MFKGNHLHIQLMFVKTFLFIRIIIFKKLDLLNIRRTLCDKLKCWVALDFSEYVQSKQSQPEALL